MKTVLNFLGELKQNNNKEWFDKNRDRYQQSKQKVLFITELINSEISKFDSEVPPMDPKSCLFRIFRDVRFSKDKSPYKTNMGSFIAKGGRKSIWPGYYLHLEPGECFVGGGSYHPPADVLKAIRTEIEDNGDQLTELLNDEDFKTTFPELYDDSLKTAPKGYPKDHPHIELLRYKSFAFGHKIDDKTVLGEELIPYIIDVFKKLHPVNQFIYEAIHKWM